MHIGEFPVIPEHDDACARRQNLAYSSFFQSIIDSEFLK